MTAIFFDLETSALHSVGQILNYCFIAVDQQWKEIERLQGLVRISRLQLPEPGAIIANGTDVGEHQKVAKDGEREAVEKIAQFLARHGGQPVYGDRPALIGYNSARFDLEKLRVAFIRNGFNPYGTVRNADLLILCRFLAATQSSFRRRLPILQNEKGVSYIGTKLEQITRAHGLLTGDQLHESSFDVELTIKLARYIQEKYQIDIRTWQPYLLTPQHAQPGKPQLLSSFDAQVPEHGGELSAPTVVRPYTFLREKDGYAFWGKLDACLEAKKTNTPLTAKNCVVAFKRESALVWPSPEPITAAQQAELAPLAAEVAAEFYAVTMDDLYPRPSCYVEAFIYLVRDTRELYAAIRSGGRGQVPQLSKEARTILRRYLLDTATESEMTSVDFRQSFVDYCAYRYGGKMQLAKSLDFRDEEDEALAYHPTFEALLGDLQVRLEAADPKSKKVLESLQQFYISSEIYKALKGKQLQQESVHGAQP